MKQRPEEIATPPDVLLAFDPDQWPGSATETSWFPAFSRWREARHRWAAEHRAGGGLGDPVDLVRAEVRARRAWQVAP